GIINAEVVLYTHQLVEFCWGLGMIWVTFILGMEVMGKPSGGVLVRKCPESQDLMAGPDVLVCM
ncbi:hypothetical protein DVA81_18725, partial [Acinetobacter baumannii]